MEAGHLGFRQFAAIPWLSFGFAAQTTPGGFLAYADQLSERAEINREDLMAPRFSVSLNHTAGKPLFRNFPYVVATSLV
jgi:hypothetical protein